MYERNAQTVPVPSFRESEMRTCQCCHPVRSRTIITVDPFGREQFTCPKTRITMRYSEGAQTYLGGHIVLPPGYHGEND
jgi:hypothetical protein